MLRTAILKTPTYLTIGVGMLLVGYQYWVGPIPMLAQLIVCIMLLLAAGIPHGALDHLIEQEYSTRLQQPFSMGRFIMKYLLLIAAYGVVWLVAPVLSLVLFLGISAWHFGETDLENAPETPYWSAARFMAGGLVLAFILLTHIPETTPIVARIVQQNAATMHVWDVLSERAGLVLAGWCGLTLLLVGVAFRHRPILINGWRLGRLGVVLLLTYPLPLLPAFLLYFGGWHALSSFGSIQAYLKLPAYSAYSAWRLWWQALPLTIAAFFFLGVCTAVWYTYVPNLDPIPTLFILLSTITLPHIRVMHKLNIVNN
ncbi:Brp/Blh family beta-carotene 15,15'-dioxygenase [Fibrella aquatica]|jgi:beta-carotene 15,15'-dioxygenase|uniref:Brp/Blh family beta-carotene 15,15'-dioxygenase n=1 Tax=Fibrella aquatica TaxID=3242487 RepID=UPI003522BEFD